MDEVLRTGRQRTTEQKLQFTGRGGEYFKIWIINLFLTIVTLGVYSAWAKVRRLRYFYRHAELAGSGFDFHGNPVRILIGRILALALFGAYKYAVDLKSAVSIGIVALVALIAPALLRNSLRFRLYNSSWRGTRFHFRGSIGGAYRVFLLNPLLAGLTLGILVPFGHQRLKAYQHGNSWFGKSPFSFHAGVGGFYSKYLIILAFISILSVVAGPVGYGTLQALGTPSMYGKLALVWSIMTVITVSIGAIFNALLTNLIWSNTRLGDHLIECALSPWGLLWVVVSNFALTAVTLGFYYPWAAVRLARFQLEAITIHPAGDLQDFMQAEPEEIGAIGEEAASLFDFDISL